MDTTTGEREHNWRQGFLALALFSAMALFVVEVGPAAVAGQGDPAPPTSASSAQDASTTSLEPLGRVFGVAGDGDLRTELLAEAREGLVPLVVSAGDEAGDALGVTLALQTQARNTTTTTVPPSTTTTPATPTTEPAPPANAAAAPPVAGGSVWDDLAQCEASGNWATNTGNGYYGGLQFSLATWQHHGGEDFAAYPHEANREQQIAVAERLVAAHGGSFGAWPSCRSQLGLP